MARNGADVSIRPMTWRAQLILFGIVAALFALTYVLDARTGDAPYHHLYYLPIILAGFGTFRYASAIAGLCAVVLYHLANPALLSSRYREADIVQILVFVGIGVVTAKLADDRRQLRLLAHTDDLTGLLNLRGFAEGLRSAIRAARRSNAPLSLLVLDLDRLKMLNDTHGHLTGGDAVRSVGHVIKTELPRGAFACRFGGDEFVVALPDTGLAAARGVAQGLRDGVSALAPTLAGVPFPEGTLSISVGVACRQDFSSPSTAAAPDGDLGEALFRAADRALYVAKAAGRNQVMSADAVTN